MPNSWYKQAYVQGFDCDNMSFIKAANMFKRMEISESIYEDVVTLYYQKILGYNTTVLDSLVIIEEELPCQTLTPRSMGMLASAVNDV